MSAKNLLVELFVEELPPKALKKLGESFGLTLRSELHKEGLLAEGSITTAFASPRRLAAHISRVRDKGPDKNIRKKLMPATVALEGDGARAAIGQGQFAARDAAPAATAVVGLLEPVRLQLPQGVEAGQAVVGEDRAPAFVDEILHRRSIFSRSARRRAICPST